MNNIFNAMTALEHARADHDVAYRACKFFFAKYPELALESLDEIVGTESVTTCIVPVRSDAPYRMDGFINATARSWNGGTYKVPAKCMTFVKRCIANDRKVEGIKELRAALGIGLKEAKDLYEFIQEVA